MRWNLYSVNRCKNEKNFYLNSNVLRCQDLLLELLCKDQYVDNTSMEMVKCQASSMPEAATPCPVLHCATSDYSLLYTATAFDMTCSSVFRQVITFISTFFFISRFHLPPSYVYPIFSYWVLVCHQGYTFATSDN